MNIDELKHRATGQWPEIIARVCSISLEAMSGKQQPCPKCGGKDRFKVFKDFDKTGGMICNQCGAFADGFEVIKWLNGVDFREAVRLVADYLGVKMPASRKRSKFMPPEKRVIQLDGGNREKFAAEFAKANPGCEVEQIMRCRWCPCAFARLSCLAFVSHNPLTWQPHSWVLYRTNGEHFPEYKNSPAHKTHFLPGVENGEQNGLVIVGSVEEFQAATQVWICEGVTGALATSWVLASPQFEHPKPIAVAIICGAGSFPSSWKQAFTEKETVIVVGDNDPSGVGRTGALKVAEALL